MKTRRLARTALVAVVSAAALVGTGCGGKEEVTTEAKTEGIWIDSGPLDYHVQGSRVLEPGLVPDNAYLQGLPEGVAQPEGDEVWFGIFLRIENRTEEAAPTARDIEVVDTEDRAYTPLGLDPKANPFAYVPRMLSPDQVVPVPDSAQDLDSFSGSLLLFKIPLESYQNRPLSLVIHSAGGDGPEEARLDLDV